jgi:hypothetical protein
MFDSLDATGLQEAGAIWQRTQMHTASLHAPLADIADRVVCVLVHLPQEETLRAGRFTYAEDLLAALYPGLKL